MKDRGHIRLKLIQNDNEVSELPNFKNNICNRVESSNVNLKILNNNKTFLNNLNNDNNNMIIRNVSKDKNNEFKKENKTQKKDSGMKKINPYTKPVNFNNYKNSSYRLLFYNIFHCLLFEKAKVNYKIDQMNRKTFQKKLDILNYLNLLKRVDMLFFQVQVNKEKIKNTPLMEFIS